ncbi:hypothetical protein PG985_011183 [Apiospora marii]|uniref:uncharacterized protein n=1 Tax=Apiospora marii TaxID=335849 RepID=UPI00313205BF
MNKQNPKKDSLESLFDYLVTDDASVDLNLSYGSTPELYWHSDESVVVIGQNKDDRRESDLEGKATENTGTEGAKLPNMGGGTRPQSDPGQAHPKSVGSAGCAQYCGCSCTTLGREFEDKVLSAVADLMDRHIRAVIPVLVEEAVREATAGLKQVADETAREEMDRHVAEACHESMEERVQAITSRLEELDENALERVFMQRSTVDILKRLVERAEADLALMEWEKI